MTLDGNTIIDGIILLYGLYTLFGILVKPDFYWESKRLQMRRERVGDQTVVRMYLFLAVLMIGLGAYQLFF
ncbi:MAG: hypothetical protein AAF614_02885 [Chloroflexota bacterium]